MIDNIRDTIKSHIAVQEALLNESSLLTDIQHIIEAMVDCFRQGGKVLLCGNGGSAADAQHIAAELSVRFLKDRKALFAEALHTNSSFITSVAN